jgi:amidase
MERGTFYVPHDIAAPIRGAAHGPLAGLTAVVKDMYDIAGTRTGGGSPEWLASREPAVRHASAVQKLLDAGVTITGKTICEELFYSMVGHNAHYGMPVNVRAPGRIPGGSSSGSAAACGAGACDIALGSDTAGSIRIPASFNGIWGIRASHGRVDMTGAMSMAPTFDASGWMAASAGVLRLAGRVLLRGVRDDVAVTRLLIARDLLTVADAEVAELCRRFLSRAASQLPPPTEVVAAPGGFEEWGEAFRVVQAREVWETFGAFVTLARPALGPGIRERIAFAATVTGAQAESARRIIRAAQEHARALVPPGTILALPTSPSIAPLPDADGRALDSFRLRVMRLTSLAGFGGLPQITLPAGTVGGCPVGVSLIGWPGGDEVLLDLGVELARSCGVVVGGQI